MRNGQSARFILLDECLPLRPETNLQPPAVNTVRNIVAKHLPENEPLPKRNWLQRWITNPQPDEPARSWLFEPPSGALNPMDYYGEAETPYADSLIDRLTEAHTRALTEAEGKGILKGVSLALRHIEYHYANLDNETMTDGIARAVTYDCIEILRDLHDACEQTTRPVSATLPDGE